MFAIDTQGDSVYQDTRRYMAVQRGDLSLLDNLKVGLSQVAVYGGPDQNPEAYYLNPLGLYYVMQRNNGVNISGLWSVDLWWKPSPPMTLYLQYLIDDIIVNNEPGQDDRAVHPDRFGVLAKAVISNSMFAGLQTGITYARVWNWTYTSYRSYENYIYHLKSLGYPLNAVEDFKLEMDYFGRPPFILHFKVGLRRHGNQSLLQPFQDTKDAFPIGTVERTGWGQVSLDYLPSPAWYVRLRLQYQSIDNELNIEDRKRDYFLAQLVLGLNLWADLK
jgi:hypothetical protein